MDACLIRIGRLPRQADVNTRRPRRRAPYLDRWRPARLACACALFGAVTAAANQPGSRASAQAILPETGERPAEKSGLGRDEAPEQFVRVGVDERVTMHLADLPLAEALRMLSEPTKRNIILAKGAGGTVSASLYNVTFKEALDAMLVSNNLGYRVDGDFIFVYPIEDLAKLDRADRKIDTRIYHLSYMNASAVRGLLEPLLSAEVGKITVTPPSRVGLGSSSSSRGSSGSNVSSRNKETEGDAIAEGDTLIITDYVDRLEQLEKLIKQLDVRPKQVLIEATILRATLNENNALGIDFTTVGGVDFGQVNSTSPAAQSIATGALPQNQLDNTSYTLRTDFNSGFQSGGFTFGVIKNQVGVFLRALEQITDTNVLANPKVLALNKQFGEIIVGRRDGFITTTITETTTAQSVEFLETGTILTFRPFIGNDGYVRMEIHPKDSTGGLTEANLPFEQTTEVTTNIMVKDGRTILIGGLFRELSTATRGQVPLLGDLPVAGALFRSTEDNTVREEVIILLTVHVVKDDPDTEASKQLNEDIERFRVGMRRGMQWFGRERLAQAHYRWAQDHLARGQTGMALWNARLALHNDPRHIYAAKLIEKLQDRRDWESEASTIRTFLRDRIQEEKGKPYPPFGRPAPPFVLPEELEKPVGMDSDSQGATEARIRQGRDKPSASPHPGQGDKK